MDEAIAASTATANAAHASASNHTTPDHLLKRLEYLEGKQESKQDFMKSVGAQLLDLRE